MRGRRRAALISAAAPALRQAANQRLDAQLTRWRFARELRSGDTAPVRVRSLGYVSAHRLTDPETRTWTDLSTPVARVDLPVKVSAERRVSRAWLAQADGSSEDAGLPGTPPVPLESAGGGLGDQLAAAVLAYVVSRAPRGYRVAPLHQRQESSRFLDWLATLSNPVLVTPGEFALPSSLSAVPRETGGTAGWLLVLGAGAVRVELLGDTTDVAWTLRRWGGADLRASRDVFIELDESRVRAIRLGDSSAAVPGARDCLPPDVES